MSKTIVITGNSCKTVFSYYLANYLATDKKKVLMVSTDNNIPTCRLLMPTNKNTEDKSLGEILCNVVIDKTCIMDNTVISSANSNLGIISYTPFKMANNYQELTQSGIEDFFRVLYSLADYIVVDTQTTVNDIDKYAISTADVCLCISTADYKGLAYRQEKKLQNSINILYCNNPYNPVEDILHTFDKQVKYIIPFIKELQPIYNGVNITDIKCPKSLVKVIEKLNKDVIIGE